MLRGIKSTFGAIGALLIISGCVKSPNAAPPGALREMARNYLIGVTYDQALIASRQENPDRLRSALNRLDELNAINIAIDLKLSHAEDRVRSGMRLQTQAYQIRNRKAALSHQIEGQATQEYRSALRWSPRFPSKDPVLLNALGYSLAEHGVSPKDFALALELTSRAVAILDRQITASAADGAPDQTLQIEVDLANTRDSQAWALYKLKRFSEAEAAQNEALAQAKNSKMDSVEFAELWWHQGKILQAQGKIEAANAAMKESKRLNGNGIWESDVEH
jgi:tetratricopeptide (TPR) repeat protein